ncbi:MAG: LLM class flavin-dependent oxidoreductase [Chloroflexi bacterium]|nr:LLM class flavin-dependent oxidoreductase [Chloroflexota bacterium]MDA1240496.1 LLM class flavin-dependent oxidoreductase [Chloroflexota bacterium]
MVQLSVLDQSPIREGGTAAQALRETVMLAQAVERLGYDRFWLAEHHGSGGLASAAPEIVIAHVAEATERIRVGSGGVMLSHYSSLKVAEQFRTLEAFHPGRIDLGVGRAPGGSQLASAALAHGPGALTLDQYPEQVRDLVLYLADGLPEDHRFHGMQATPIVEGVPQVWCLGSSLDSALIAAEVGLPFSFAQFINPEAGPRAVKLYRERFRPSVWCPEPRISVGISALAAPTEEEAIRLSWSRYCWRFRRGGIPSVETALAFKYSDPELAYVEYSRPKAAIGTPDQVKAKVEAVAEEMTADEVMLLTITYDFADRIRSYELIAEAFGLTSVAENAAAGRG